MYEPTGRWTTVNGDTDCVIVSGSIDGVVARLVTVSVIDAGSGAVDPDWFWYFASTSRRRVPALAASTKSSRIELPAALAVTVLVTGWRGAELARELNVTR